jgi:hypothetical protein
MTDTKQPSAHTDDSLAESGWAAWSRDSDGLLCTAHAPFYSNKELAKYVSDEVSLGRKVCFPNGPVKMEKRK